MGRASYQVTIEEQEGRRTAKNPPYLHNKERREESRYYLIIRINDLKNIKPLNPATDQYPTKQMKYLQDWFCYSEPQNKMQSGTSLIGNICQSALDHNTIRPYKQKNIAD